jgi:hypothetical protein
MTPERLAELERVLAEVEAEEERRCVWATVERQKLERIRAAQKKAEEEAKAQPPKPVVRKKGGWVFVAKGKIVPPGNVS